MRPASRYPVCTAGYGNGPTACTACTRGQYSTSGRCQACPTGTTTAALVGGIGCTTSNACNGTQHCLVASARHASVNYTCYHILPMPIGRPTVLTLAHYPAMSHTHAHNHTACAAGWGNYENGACTKCAKGYTSTEGNVGDCTACGTTLTTAATGSTSCTCE
jgi:hypothetical protein